MISTVHPQFRLPTPAGPAPAPRIADLSCIHRGKRLEVVECPACPLQPNGAKKRVQTYACAVHGKCALANDQLGIASCHVCKERVPDEKKKINGNPGVLRSMIFDEHNLFPALPGKRFNSSIIEYGDGYLMAFRDGWRGSEIHLAHLNSNFYPVRHHKLALRHALAPYGREDPRLFRFGGLWGISFIGVFGRERILHTHQLYARLNDDFSVHGLFYPDFSGRRDWEKNWQFIEFERKLFAVHTITPHRILSIDGSTASIFGTVNWNTPWRGGEMRGGAAPVLVGDEFYSFFHDSITINGLKTYRTGCYTFEAKPPFRPLRCTREPLLVADRDSKPKDQYAAVVFTCGAVLRDGQWILSSGIHDRFTRIDFFDATDVERRLERV